MKHRRPHEHTFNIENIRKCEAYVLSMQQRLDRAVANNDEPLIRKTFDTLVRRSFAIRVLAVWNITHQNEGKKTAGVDGVKIPKGKNKEETDKIRLKLLDAIDIQSAPNKIKRTYIPKANGKKRPLGIPTLADRINQEILRIAIEPIAEYHAHDNSYGFRPKRSCHDVMALLQISLAPRNRKRYILEGDIKSCFDNISHRHIRNTLRHWKIPKYACNIISKMLKAKIFYEGKITEKTTGTPQGGVISPLLANIALTSFDHYISLKYGNTVYYGRGKHQNSPMIRYADDFVILCESKTQAKEIRQDITDYLSKQIGLTLSKEKTRITHIKKGFNFLGFNIRKYPKSKHHNRSDIGEYKLIIRPQKEKVIQFLRKCFDLIDNNKQAKQENLISHLNDRIRGWGNYYRFCNRTKTFSKSDNLIWHKLWKWARRRSKKNGAKWTREKYYVKRPNRKSLHFSKNGITIQRLCDIPLPKMRYPKVKNGYRLYNIHDRDYWIKRENEKAKQSIYANKGRYFLLKRQKGVCDYCNTPISAYDIQEKRSHVHHIIPKAKGGKDSYSNLRLLHTECHREIHSK